MAKQLAGFSYSLMSVFIGCRSKKSSMLSTPMPTASLASESDTAALPLRAGPPALVAAVGSATAAIADQQQACSRLRTVKLPLSAG